MRLLSLVLVCCSAVCADVVPITIGPPLRHGGSIQGGLPFSTPVQPFDSSMGTLDSATINVRVTTEIHYSIYDIGVLPGLSFSAPVSVNWTGPYFDVTGTGLVAGTTTGTNSSSLSQPARNVIISELVKLTLTGDALAPFIGSGYASITGDRKILDWVRFGVTASDSDGHTGAVAVFSGVTIDNEVASGEYNYTPLAVAPEPRLIAMTLALLAFALWSGRRSLTV